jgi:hypothetical protein
MLEAGLRFRVNRGAQHGEKIDVDERIIAAID